MKTDTWNIVQDFEMPIDGKNIKFVSYPTKKPLGLSKIIRTNWGKQLQDQFEKVNKPDEGWIIKPYHLDSSKNPLNAIYKGDKPDMWPGPVVTMVGYLQKNDSVKIMVDQSFYPYNRALNDDTIKDMYAEAGILLPRPALGIDTFVITTDGLLTLTVRGDTNVYPNIYHNQGGDIELVTTKVVEYQIDEIAEEIMVSQDQYNPADFRFLGLTEDQLSFPRKPNLTGYIPINVSSQEVREQVNSRPLEERPNDSVDVAFAPANESGLYNYLTKETMQTDFTPPCHAGLVLYGKHMHGEKWADAVVSEINSR
ncbi:hypothetical protein HQ533_06320 [Candidatus Woesearchaeota archaeon]|nr:hypothetical protein [Candidatus Woesearchaeota archaeon]